MKLVLFKREREKIDRERDEKKDVLDRKIVENLSSKIEYKDVFIQ